MNRWKLTFCLGLIFLSSRLLSFAQGNLFITEFMAANGGSVLDQDGDSSDWLEIYNAGPEAVDLGGWYLSDQADYLPKWTFPSTNLPPGGFQVVFASGKNRAVSGQELHANFSLSSSGSFLALVKPDGATIAHAYSPAFPNQIFDVSYGVDADLITNSFVATGDTTKWKIPQSSGAMPSDWASTNFDDSAWSSGHTGLGFDFGGELSDQIQTDISGSMRNVNATALARIHFFIGDEALPFLNTLLLRMKYDDGFVAYLNGTEIARRNAPLTPAWNSSATATNADSAVAVFEDIDVSAFIGLIQEGDNVLAIQGLNISASDDDFLLLPELTGYTTSVSPERYYSVPTPGAPNSAAYLGVVADTKFSVDRGLFTIPFSLSITSATTDAVIRYTLDGSPPTPSSGLIYSNPVSIDHSTVVRAMATKPGYQSTDIDTHTYVFISNVLAQSSQSAIDAGYPSSWGPYISDYAMDPNVTGPYAAQMEPALRSLPSVFISTTISNLFNSTNGIYVQSTQHGNFWERPAAVEMVDTNGETEFALGCGIRIQGAYFRDNSHTRKHSFRLLFKSEYGPGTLKHDVFKTPGVVKEFDGLVLRANGNDGYSWNYNGTGGAKTQFIRDEFGRRLLFDMGFPSAYGTFVNLYVNGLYWGLYNLCERPNEDFSTSYLGGNTKDWLAIVNGGSKDGDFAPWIQLSNQVRTVNLYSKYMQLQGLNTDGTRNPAYTNLFDKEDYIHYMLVELWGGNQDWPNNNYWMGYQRTTNSTGFKFYIWDYEDTIDSARSSLTFVAPKNNIWVGWPHSILTNFFEYKMEFADRAQRYMFNGGLLTPQVLTNRYRQLADLVQPAVVAESARWGDDQGHFPPYGLTEWTNERNYILNTYLQQRTTIALQQFRNVRIYPTNGAPVFSQFGGAVTQGFALTITHTNTGGTLWYTLDGSDPRRPGSYPGALSPTIIQYTGTPIPINGPTLVRSRAYRFDWSALTEAVFTPPQDLTKLALTEIMYHAPNVGATNGDEFDFLEMKNVGTNLLNLSGLTFTAGVNFTFTNATFLAPGQFFVIARNAAAMASKYPGVTIKGIFTGKLDNGGETITLSQPGGAIVFSVTYNNKLPWPIAADGFGFSLVPKFPGASQAPDDGAKWRASSQIGGSLGADDPAATIPPVVINELLTHTVLPQLDSIELYNPSGSNADISGWYLTDDAAIPRKYQIPNGTVLPPGGYIYFDESQFNSAPGSTNNFALSSLGDDAYLFSANTNGQLTGYSHGVSFGAAFTNVSFGRYVDSAGEEHYPLQSFLTLNAPNAGPRFSPVVINELNYHPDTNGDEFVELLNVSPTTVFFFDQANPTNTWKINGIGFTFPTNISLNPGATMLIVQTNPADFRVKYSVPVSVQIFGPYGGNLQDSGESIELQVPDVPETNGVVPYVSIDEVRYNDKAPWPPGADGTGLSLQRLHALSYGSEPANWFAALPTPGTLADNSDADGDGLPDWWEMANGTDWRAADADADPDGDGMSNLQEYLAGTDPHDSASTLRIVNLTPGSDSFTLEFTAMSNRTYTVLYKDQLMSATWTKLLDVPSYPTNHVEQISDTPLSSDTRFYRIVTPSQ